MGGPSSTETSLGATGGLPQYGYVAKVAQALAGRAEPGSARGPTRLRHRQAAHGWVREHAVGRMLFWQDAFYVRLLFVWPAECWQLTPKLVRSAFQKIV